MYGPSDQYGDLNLEDVDEFEGLQPDDDKELNFLSRFQPNEVRSFDDDFGYVLDRRLAEEEDFDDPEWSEEEALLSEESI